jgi:hypothetical protein
MLAVGRSRVVGGRWGLGRSSVAAAPGGTGNLKKDRDIFKDHNLF